MSWDWSTTVVGLGGIVAVYLQGRTQAKSNKKLAKFQAEADLRAQREALRQKRIEAVYPGLLDALTAGNRWLWEVESFTTGSSSYRWPPAPPDAVADLTKVGALPAVASEQMAVLLGEWESAAYGGLAFAKMMAIFLERDPDRPLNFPEGWPHRVADTEYEAKFAAQRYEKFQSMFRRALKAEAMLRDQVRRELAGQEAY